MLLLTFFVGRLISGESSGEPAKDSVVVTPGKVTPGVVTPGRVTPGMVTEGSIRDGGASVEEEQASGGGVQVDGHRVVTAVLNPVTGSRASGTIRLSEEDESKRLRIILRIQGLEPRARIAISFHPSVGSMPSVDRAVTDAFNAVNWTADDRGEAVIVHMVDASVPSAALAGKAVAIHAVGSAAPGDIAYRTPPVAVGVLTR